MSILDFEHQEIKMSFLASLPSNVSHQLQTFTAFFPPFRGDQNNNSLEHVTYLLIFLFFLHKQG